MSDIKSELNELIEIWHELEDLDLKLAIAIQFIEIRNQNLHLFEDDISAGVPDNEVWVNCKGWEDLYQISSWGRIKGVETFFIKTTNGRTMSVYKPERIRTKRYHRFGYLRTSFWRDEKVTHYSCHRLVALHFIPNPNNYPQVLHKDDDPKNARWDNLFWGTQKDNIQDCVSKGRWHMGSKNGNSKLKDSQIPEIRKLIKEGVSERKIATRFKVGRYAITAIKRGITWRNK
jgi:hypothetical protein